MGLLAHGLYINLPIGVGLIMAARVYIQETPRLPSTFDLAGALTSTLGMSALVYGFIRSAHAGWHDTVTLAMLLGAVVLLTAFVFIERRAAQPILPLRLFARRERAGAYAARVLYIGAMVGFFFFTTLYLQEVVGYNPALTGLAFVPATILHFPIAIAVPKLVRRFTPNQLLVVGIPIGIAGMAWLSRASADSGYVVSVALPMLLIGISQGLTLSPLTSAGVVGVDHTDAGAASGAVNVAHQLGSSVGLSVLVAAAVIGSSSLMGHALTAHRVAMAFDAATIMLAISFVVVLVAIVLPRKSGPPPRTPGNERDNAVASVADEAACAVAGA